LPIGFAALRTSRLKTRPTVVAKDRGKGILRLALLTNHNGNQSQLGCIILNSIKAHLRERIEGNRQTSVYYRAGLKASKRIVTFSASQLSPLKQRVARFKTSRISKTEQLGGNSSWKRTLSVAMAARYFAREHTHHLTAKS